MSDLIHWTREKVEGEIHYLSGSYRIKPLKGRYYKWFVTGLKDQAYNIYPRLFPAIDACVRDAARRW
jgi:hypothetical protein